MKRGVWEKKKLTGTELRGKTLGIVGFGRIGREVALRARAFGMEILAHDPFISARAAEAAGVPLVGARRRAGAIRFSDAARPGPGSNPPPAERGAGWRDAARVSAS